MDKLPSNTVIPEIIAPTFQAYLPLLLTQSARITSTHREEFTYGPHPRHKLDVYTPSPTSRLQNTNTVLIFFYGGGLVAGDKIDEKNAQGLVYANLAHYFAERLGITVVIPDYRLISHGAAFPSGGEDVSLAIQWVEGNIRPSLSSSSDEGASGLDIFLMGNSAGGLHLATFLLASDFAQRRKEIANEPGNKNKLKGAVLLSVPLHFQRATSGRAPVLEAYYKGKVGDQCPLGLLKASSADGAPEGLGQMGLLVATAAMDPEDEILTPNRDFVNELRKSEVLAEALTVVELPGHNHISPVLSLGTGIQDEEAWGEEVVKFIEKHTA